VTAQFKGDAIQMLRSKHHLSFGEAEQMVDAIIKEVRNEVCSCKSD
jgi:nucleoid DNA-binding protein